MTVYAVQKILHLVAMDPAFRAEMQRDPAAAISGFPLTDQERTALLAGDVTTLLELGVHGFLLVGLALFGIAGLTVPDYVQRAHQAKMPLDSEV